METQNSFFFFSGVHLRLGLVFRPPFLLPPHGLVPFMARSSLLRVQTGQGITAFSPLLKRSFFLSPPSFSVG